MKKIATLMAFVLTSVIVCAWTSPISIPDMGNARLHIVGQNAHNYLTTLTAQNAEAKTEAALKVKTDKMANAFLALEADIVAICEAEENDSILGYLTAEMNAIYGSDVYTYITDGLQGSLDDQNYMPTKAGFVYRKDKVSPYLSSFSPYYSGIYNARLRIQCFTEISSGEKFMLSMNHFKAKDSTEDEGESKRVTNANTLLNKLNSSLYDPDVLVMGDLNSYTDEEPVTMIIAAGYEEQLVHYDANAYSYCYYGSNVLLDHALANSTMAEQITGAGVYHINTLGNSSYKYSDHDGYVVGLRLGKDTPEGIKSATVSNVSKVLRNGQIYILRGEHIYDITGRLIQ